MVVQLESLQCIGPSVCQVCVCVSFVYGCVCICLMSPEPRCFTSCIIRQMKRSALCHSTHGTSSQCLTLIKEAGGDCRGRHGATAAVARIGTLLLILIVSQSF